jgi:hypothetical protein
MALSKAEILQASRERDRHKRQGAIFMGVGLIVLIVGLFLLLLNLSFLRVNSIKILGQTSADPEIVKGFIDNQLAGRYLYLVPKSSVFFVSKGILAKDISRQFPGLAKVTITWPDLNTLAVLIVDRESKVLWCVDGEKNKNCYYLSPEGTAYQEAPSFSDSLFIELHSKQPLKKIGDKVIDQKTLIRTTAFLNFMKSSMPLWPKASLSLSFAEVYSQNDFIAFLSDQTNPLWQAQVLFNIDRGANNLITDFHSVLKNEKFQSDWKAGNGQLNYLDLRFPGKVFYRFK